MLTESLELNIEENDIIEDTVARKVTKKKKPRNSQYIDGKKLSKHELDFEEFRSKQFNSEKWLKKNRLSF